MLRRISLLGLADIPTFVSILNSIFFPILKMILMIHGKPMLLLQVAWYLGVQVS